jgi:putative PIN family toxin of toxin-antitoxin system
LDNSKQLIVINTSVWISGLIFGGTPAKVIRKFIDGDIVVVMSEELLSELRRKINPRFSLFLPALPRLDASIQEKAILVQLGSRPVTASRDADDNMAIETALVGKAGYIVSGDKDLLVLEEYEGVKLLNPAGFMRL